MNLDNKTVNKLNNKMTSKLKITLALVVVCFVLVIAVSYAWIVLAMRPEVHTIDTNIGANGSLEIALLTEQTYADPVQIRTMAADSAVEQDALVTNQSWGNVIDLQDERYGLSKITLLPARLNVFDSENGYTVGSSMLKTAEYGLDGRISILSEKTASATLSNDSFTYYADQQSYGVRAIGTVSNLSSQQTSLAIARSTVKSNTAAAARTVKYAWRDYGAGIMDILFQRYSAGSDSFTAADVAAIRDLANEVLEALDYVDAALRQGIIGVAASQIADGADFESICEIVSNTAVPLSAIVESLGSDVPTAFAAWAEQVDEMKIDVQLAVTKSYTLSSGGNWNQIEPMLDVLLDAEKGYLGETSLASKEAYDSMTGDNLITLAPDSGVLAKIAAYTGNYSAFAMWTDTVSVEARTTDPSTTSYLNQIEDILENSQAASGGWTRSNLDDVYAFAVDLAFRCNETSDLLLQTGESARVEGNSVTQGSGSYMRFSSENMDTEQLLKLMDTIRIGFLSDQNTLLGVAKLNVSNYEVQEEGVFAPLYLYEYEVTADGRLSIGQRLTDDVSITSLQQNSPKVITVVVWLDGDYVDNSMVGDTVHQSMDGVLNLQFASSADLLPAEGNLKK